MTIRRPTVVLVLLAVVAALTVPLTLGASRSAGASVAVDVSGSTLDFDYGDHTNIAPAPGTDCTGSGSCTGKTVGDIVRFNGVATVGGTTIDAVVTTVASPYAVTPGTPETAEIERYEASSSVTQPEGFYFRVENNANPGTAAMAGFTFTFYVAGTYTGPGTGVPVTLENTSVHIDDIDEDQFVQLSDVVGYTLSAPTKVTYNAADLRFENVSGSGSDQEKRAYVEYASLESLTVYGGDYYGDSASFEVVFGPAVWATECSVWVTNSLADSLSRIDASVSPPVVAPPLTVGTGPVGVAVRNDGERVYTADSGANTVTKLDTTTTPPSIDATISTGNNPIGLALSSGGSRAWVTNQGDSTLTYLLASAEIVDGAASTGTGPVAVGAAPNSDFVAVADLDVDTVTFLAGEDSSIIGLAIGVGDAPAGIAVSPDGSRVYVANSGDDTVSVIDSWALPPVVVGSPISVGDAPRGIAVSPDGSRVYVANSGADTVSVIDATATPPSVIATITVGDDPRALALSGDGLRLWVANYGADTVSPVDLVTAPATVGTPISVGDGPAGVAAYCPGTQSTGPVVAESVAISTSTAVPTIGWSSSPVTDPADWTAPTCAAYAAADTTFTTPLSGTLSPGIYVTHCTGATAPVDFTVTGYTDGELVVYGATPTVTTIAPTSGPTAGGTPVTVTGTGFVSGQTAVWIGGVPCTPVSVSGPTSLTCTTGARTAGTVDVFVQTYGTLSSTGGAGLYTYTSSGPPPAPTGVTATTPPSGSTATEVDATPPASGPTPNGYQVRCMPVEYPWHIGDGGPVRYVGTPTLPVTVRGLVRGLTYKCFVRARYDAELRNWPGDSDEGPISEASNRFVVPRTVPPAPTGATVTVPDGGSVAVSFTASPNDSGSPVTSAAARCTSSNGGVTRTGAGPSSPVTVTNLTPGKRYSCSGADVNAVGTSAWSTPSAVFEVPPVVTGVIASVTSPRSRTVQVRFVPAPGVAASRYDVTCTTIQGRTLTFTGTGTASPVGVGPVKAVRFYRCTVRGAYPTGTGSWSAPSNTVKVG